MSAFDRNKYAAVRLSKLKDVQKDAKKASGETDGRVGYLSIEDGRNIFRIAPAHNPEDSPYVPVRTTMLQCEVDVYENGEKTDKKEVKNKKIFISTIHSVKLKDGSPSLPKDPVELYIEYVKKLAETSLSSKEEKAKFLNPIKGYRNGKKWVPGITPSTKYACYAWDGDGKMGRLELNPNWMRSMEKISLEESNESTFDLDVFSDPNEGLPLIITKGQDDKGQTKYDVSAERPRKGEDWSAFFDRVRVSDNQLQALEQQKPLSSFYIGVYTDRDFNLAVDGLSRFDEENNYGIFGDHDFIDELEEIAKMVPEYKKEETESKNGKDIDDAFSKHGSKGKLKEKESVKSKKEVETEEEEELSPLEMKRFLRKYIAKEYGDDTEFPTDLSSKELVKWYNLAKSGDELPFPTKVEETEEEEKSEFEEDGEDAAATRAAIERLRRQRKK